MKRKAMPGIKIKREDCRLTAAVRISSGEAIDEWELDYLTGKQIRGLMQPVRVKRWAFHGLVYKGPVAVSIREYLKKPVRRHDFFFMMALLADLARRLGEARLRISRLLTDPDYVFINPVTRELFLLYLPLDLPDRQGDLPGLMMQMIYLASPEGPEDREAISAFIYFLKNQAAFDPLAIDRYIRRADGSIAGILGRDRADGSIAGILGRDRADGSIAGILSPDRADGGYSPQVHSPTGSGDAGNEETGLLCFPVLERVKSGAQIEIRKGTFLIGKDSETADYIISDNPMISRRHAGILCRDGRYYVSDLGSKNGSYLNGRRLDPGYEAVLTDGDELCLADETFVFLL